MGSTETNLHLCLFRRDDVLHQPHGIDGSDMYPDDQVLRRLVLLSPKPTRSTGRCPKGNPQDGTTPWWGNHDDRIVIWRVAGSPGRRTGGGFAS